MQLRTLVPWFALFCATLAASADADVVEEVAVGQKVFAAESVAEEVKIVEDVKVDEYDNETQQVFTAEEGLEMPDYEDEEDDDPSSPRAQLIRPIDDCMDSDECCHKLFDEYYKETHQMDIAPVESLEATMFDAKMATFECSDTRTDEELEKAGEGEVRSVGPYSLTCPKGYRADIVDAKTARSDTNGTDITKAVCNDAFKSWEAHIQADEQGCVETEEVTFEDTFLSAYTASIRLDPDYEKNSAFFDLITNATTISITKLGSEAAEDTKSVEEASVLDYGAVEVGAKYKACATAPPGSMLFSLYLAWTTN